VTVRVDSSDINRLAADLLSAGPQAAVAIRATTVRAAVKIRDNARQAISGLEHAPHYPQSITYDLEQRPDGVTAVIGPDKDRTQGALGNILEFGTSKNPPHAHLGPSLDREAGTWLRYVTEAAADVL
jgi:hypothetical protein